MTRETTRTILWLSAILVCLSVLGMSPSASLLTAVLAGIPAAVSVLFGAGRLRIVGVLLLILTLAVVYNHYPPYKKHMDRYLQHAESHR
jgi:membrane protein implicated in regulation of membrane protease activity